MIETVIDFFKTITFFEVYAIVLNFLLYIALPLCVFSCIAYVGIRFLSFAHACMVNLIEYILQLPFFLWKNGRILSQPTNLGLRNFCREISYRNQFYFATPTFTFSQLPYQPLKFLKRKCISPFSKE